jgi:hypothetical protein
MAIKTDAHLESKATKSPTFGTHGQLIFGESTIYLSHLPMFMSNPANHPHNFQVILEVSLTDQGSDPQAVYVKDHQNNKDKKIYTVAPEPFDIVNLAYVDQEHTQLRSFKGSIFRGHFEHKGKHILDALINVKNVVHFHGFDPGAKELSQLEYLLFGRGDELFLAHYITKPPDFDHILSVKTVDHKFTDEELRHGVSIIFPERENTVDMKLKEGERIMGGAKIADTAEPLKLLLEVGTGFYFCADELAEQM